MTDMPVWVRLDKDSQGGFSTFAAHEESPTYTRADATLTPAEAMARCPEVAALVDVAQEALECFTPPLDPPPATLEATIALFTKGSDK